MEQQGQLLELPEAAGGASKRVTPDAGLPRKWRTAERAQMMMVSICMDELIPADHKARAIWELAGRLKLERFAETVTTVAGSAGRPAWDPKLLVSVWVYAYSEGIGSAREIARLAQYEPGFQWLCGMVEINHRSI